MQPNNPWTFVLVHPHSMSINLTANIGPKTKLSLTPQLTMAVEQIRNCCEEAESGLLPALCLAAFAHQSIAEARS